MLRGWSYRTKSVAEQLHAGVERRTSVVGIFPNEETIIRLACATLVEQNAEWAIERRCMTLERIASMTDNRTIKLSAAAA